MSRTDLREPGTADGACMEIQREAATTMKLRLFARHYRLKNVNGPLCRLRAPYAMPGTDLRYAAMLGPTGAADPCAPHSGGGPRGAVHVRVQVLILSPYRLATPCPVPT
eukprot:3561641-Rhodomonas_salina.1